MWIDATVAASFVTNPKDRPWPTRSASRWHLTMAWAFAQPALGMGACDPAGTQKEASAGQFIEWATSNSYIELVASKEGWANVPPGARTSLYQNANYKDIRLQR